MPGGAAEKKQRRYYSGKRKRHTLKAQVVVDLRTRQVVSAAFAKGRAHDFRLFGQSRTALPPGAECLADSGYLGIARRHAGSRTPHKASKLHPLTPEQRAENRDLARERIAVEHVIGRLKAFRILSERYRNRGRRFGMRFSLIAAIYNSELDD